MYLFDNYRKPHGDARRRNSLSQGRNKRQVSRATAPGVKWER